MPLEPMLSDHFRFVKILLLGMVLTGLSLYSYREGPRQFMGFWDALSQPQQNAGNRVKIGYARIAALPGEGRILLHHYDKEVEVRTSQGPFRIGDQVSVSGRIANEGYVEVDRIRVHPYRWIKKLVSLPAGVLFLLVAVSRFRVSFDRRFAPKDDSCRT